MESQRGLLYVLWGLENLTYEPTIYTKLTIFRDYLTFVNLLSLFTSVLTTIILVRYLLEVHQRHTVLLYHMSIVPEFTTLWASPW